MNASYVSRMSPPIMTYYTKLLDNATGEQIFGYASTAKNKQLYYGKVNGFNGGESQYIIEFDIWNNEPALYAGGPITTVQDATNTKLEIQIPPNSRDLNPFFYARCTTNDPQSAFQTLSMSNKTFTAIKGNCSQSLGTILGTSDHATIQTKIKLKPNSNVKYHQYAFALKFSYVFE